MNTFAPLGRTSNLPPGVEALLAANVVLYAIQSIGLLVPYLGEWIVARGALWAVGHPLFAPWQVVTSGFLHSPSDIFHLLVNMLMLWMAGTVIEAAWGTRRFLIYYAVCLVGASLTQLGAYALEGVGGWAMGASGAVLGVLLAFGVLYPNHVVYLNFFFPVKAKYLVAGYAVLSVWWGVSGSSPGVAHFAHLGGMLAGLPLALTWRRR